MGPGTNDGSDHSNKTFLRPDDGTVDVSIDFSQSRATQRTLAGATILQIIPVLRDDPIGRSAVAVAIALLQAGARAMIAADRGPLATELQAIGGEWLPFVNDTRNPIKARRNAKILQDIIVSERIDVVHAYGASAAWSALTAIGDQPVWLITHLPDAPSNEPKLLSFFQSATTKGDRIIAPSHYSATAICERYKVPRARVAVIPRCTDTVTYAPDAVPAPRIEALLKAWQIRPGERIVVVPGRVAPWNGQMTIVETAHLLVQGGMQGVVFAIVGEDHTHRRFAKTVLERAQELGVDDIVRLTGHCSDLPAAFAAADVIAVPAIEPPVFGRVVAEAQAAGKPVVTTDVGVLPENVLSPPRIPEDLRTGWVVPPDNAGELGMALATALSLDEISARAISARARQFAEYSFSPHSVAAATCGVYTSLLARDQ